MIQKEHTLENVSVVIPTARDEVKTLETIPEEVEVIVRRDEGLNIARNRGVQEASREWIVIADDDIDFPTDLLRRILPNMGSSHLLGLEDSWPLDYVIGRLMVFKRALWEQVGGFDEDRNHGGDTDFAIRCKKSGASILRLPRYTVPHYDDEGVFSDREHIDWLYYLTRKHPLTMLPKSSKIVLSRIGVIQEPEREENKQ